MLCLIILTVSFLTDCGNISLNVYGLCWMNEDTLVVAAQTTKQLWKLTVNKTARTCEGEVVDVGYKPSDVACSRDGRAFVTEYRYPRHTLSIRIYDMHLREHDVWIAAIESEIHQPSIAINDGFVVIGYNSVIYVYNREKVFLYKLNMTFGQESTKRQLYITDSNILWGVWGDKVVTVNLTSKYTHTWQYNLGAWGVGGIPHGPVFVTGHYPDMLRLYSQNGTLLSSLDIKVPNGIGFYEIAAVRSTETESLIAIDTGSIRPVLIYTLGP